MVSMEIATPAKPWAGRTVPIPNYLLGMLVVSGIKLPTVENPVVLTAHQWVLVCQESSLPSRQTSWRVLHVIHERGTYHVLTIYEDGVGTYDGAVLVMMKVIGRYFGDADD